jgi:catalase
MKDDTLAEQLVSALHRPDAAKAGDQRPVHATGISATGRFVPSPVASSYCKASHFADLEGVPVIVRFSNGTGAEKVHDGWSDVRGMATRFHLKDGSATDLIAMTLPEFFAPDGWSFLDFAREAYPKPFADETPWQKLRDMLHLTPPGRDRYPGEEIRPDEGAMAYANANPHAMLAVFQAATIGAPVSYVRASYHAVHAFVVTGADGTRRWVRFTWQPIAGVRTTDPNQTPVDDYLKQELRDRLAQEDARFTLMMVIGEAGDDFGDSTRPWPPHRVRVVMGTLTLDAVAKDQDVDCEKLSFNPMLLTPGIEPSEDRVLWIRGEAYKISSALRHATPCPFAKGNTDGA